jgi:ATP-binding cassette, subfamily B, bacterial
VTTRSLLEAVPDDVVVVVRGHLPAGEEPVMSIASDVLPDGSFGAQWVVATRQRVMVVAAGRMVGTATLEELTYVRTDSLVGGGRLEIGRVDGPPLRVVYSTSRAAKFTQFALGLQHLPDVIPELMSPPERVHCEHCRRRLPEANGICPACLRPFAILRRVMTFVKPYRARMLMLGLASAALALTTLAPPLITRHIVDDVLVSQVSPPSGVRLARLSTLVLSLVLLQCATWSVQWAQAWGAMWLAARVTADARAALYRCLQMLSLKVYDTRAAGGLMTRVTADPGTLEHFLIRGLPQLVVHALTVLAVLALMGWMDMSLALVVLLPVPVIWAWSVSFWRQMNPLLYRSSQSAASLAAELSNTLTGIRVIKAFGREHAAATKFAQANARLQNAAADTHRTRAVLLATTNLVTGLGILVLWVVGGAKVLAGDITLGTLLAFHACVWLLYGPLQWFGQLSSWTTQAATGAARIFELLDSPREAYDEPGAIRVGRAAGGVAFRHVRFGYEPGKVVLKDVDFAVEPGEVVGVVGRSGSGKTTAMQLLCRFYEVDEGRIELDGEDIRRLRLEDLRAQIGIVLQESWLARGTIAENIGYGQAGASFEAIVAAAKLANAHDFIVRKPEGYDTEVGERGQRLSGGERQRVAIARALLRQPTILILDEATASVDAESEGRIQEAIRGLRGRCTMFIITHRQSFLRGVDRLIVLDDGRVVETATSDEVLVGGQALDELAYWGTVEAAEMTSAEMTSMESPTLAVSGASTGPQAEPTADIEPQKVRLFRAPSWKLRLTIGNRSYPQPSVALAAPLSHPGRHIVFFDVAGDEIGMLRDPRDLEPDSYRILAEELRARDITAVVTHVEAVRAEMGLTHVRVTTDRGLRTFTVGNGDEDIRRFFERRIYVVDIDGNRFAIADVDHLDARSARLLSRML